MSFIMSYLINGIVAVIISMSASNATAPMPVAAPIPSVCNNGATMTEDDGGFPVIDMSPAYCSEIEQPNTNWIDVSGH